MHAQVIYTFAHVCLSVLCVSGLRTYKTVTTQSVSAGTRGCTNKHLNGSGIPICTECECVKTHVTDTVGSTMGPCWSPMWPWVWSWSHCATPWDRPRLLPQLYFEAQSLPIATHILRGCLDEDRCRIISLAKIQATGTKGCIAGGY